MPDACELCFDPEHYCKHCGTCHKCLEESQEAATTINKNQRATIESMSKDIDGLLELVGALREWVDAVPDDVELPTMPGHDRDWADEIIGNAKKNRTERTLNA